MKSESLFQRHHLNPVAADVSPRHTCLEKASADSRRRLLRRTTALLLFVAAGFTLGAQNETSPAPAQDATPCQKALHATATAAAWAAYQSGHYESAITNADECIARYGEASQRSEAVLKDKKISLPTGAVSEAEKQRIAPYQILHDVATCFLIKGWAEEKLGHKDQAKEAHAEAKKLTLARSSVPGGESFWSPAEKASESLARLEKTNSK